MKNDVLDAEKPIRLLVEWREATAAYMQNSRVAQENQLARRFQASEAALEALDPAQLRRIGTLLGQLHSLAVTASSSTGTAAQVRAARDELVRVCLELGGEA